MSNKVIKEVLEIFNRGWNKQVILYGPPGTSKTYSSTIIAAAMLVGVKNIEDLQGALIEKIEKSKELQELLEKKGEKELDRLEVFDLASTYLKSCKNYKLVQFHPSYSYEDFVRGITVKPEEKKDEEGNTVKTGNILYEVESKIIEKFCIDNKEGKKILIIDEINRAPLASVLGELIYGLEYRNEKITTPYELKDKTDLIIPDDLYIIGTMNTADRSIGSMDYAVRRRFAFIPVGSNADSISKSWEDSEDKVGNIAKDLYQELIDSDDGIFAEECKADQEMDIEDIKIGHTYFLGKKGEGKEYLAYRLQYQILPIYQEYIKDGIIDKKGLEKFKCKLEKFKDRLPIEDILNKISKMI